MLENLNSLYYLVSPFLNNIIQILSQSLGWIVIILLIWQVIENIDLFYKVKNKTITNVEINTIYLKTFIFIFLGFILLGT